MTWRQLVARCIFAAFGGCVFGIIALRDGWLFAAVFMVVSVGAIAAWLWACNNGYWSSFNLAFVLARAGWHAVC